MAKNLVTKVRVMHSNLPSWLKQQCVEDNKLNLRYKNGSQIKFVEDMLTRKDLYNLINYDSYVKMDKSLGGDDLINK